MYAVDQQRKAKLNKSAPLSCRHVRQDRGPAHGWVAGELAELRARAAGVELMGAPNRETVISIPIPAADVDGFVAIRTIYMAVDHPGATDTHLLSMPQYGFQVEGRTLVAAAGPRAEKKVAKAQASASSAEEDLEKAQVEAEALAAIRALSLDEKKVIGRASAKAGTSAEAAIRAEQEVVEAGRHLEITLAVTADMLTALNLCSAVAEQHPELAASNADVQVECKCVLAAMAAQLYGLDGNLPR